MIWKILFGVVVVGLLAAAWYLQHRERRNK